MSASHALRLEVASLGPRFLGVSFADGSSPALAAGLASRRGGSLDPYLLLLDIGQPPYRTAIPKRIPTVSLSPAESTLTDRVIHDENKGLTQNITPLNATLTEFAGGPK